MQKCNQILDTLWPGARTQIDVMLLRMICGVPLHFFSSLQIVGYFPRAANKSEIRQRQTRCGSLFVLQPPLNLPQCCGVDDFRHIARANLLRTLFRESILCILTIHPSNFQVIFIVFRTLHYIFRSEIICIHQWMRWNRMEMFFHQKTWFHSEKINTLLSQHCSAVTVDSTLVSDAPECGISVTEFSVISNGCSYLAKGADEHNVDSVLWKVLSSSACSVHCTTETKVFVISAALGCWSFTCLLAARRHRVVAVDHVLHSEQQPTINKSRRHRHRPKATKTNHILYNF